jgi:hypothetical protein
LAPVALPKTPRIDEFWAFQEEGRETPCLPAAALSACWPPTRKGL